MTFVTANMSKRSSDIMGSTGKLAYVSEHSTKVSYNA